MFRNNAALRHDLQDQVVLVHRTLYLTGYVPGLASYPLTTWCLNLMLKNYLKALIRKLVRLPALQLCQVCFNCIPADFSGRPPNSVQSFHLYGHGHNYPGTLPQHNREKNKCVMQHCCILSALTLSVAVVVRFKSESFAWRQCRPNSVRFRSSHALRSAREANG